MIEQMREDYDWQEAFKYGDTIKAAMGCDSSKFVFDDVAEVFAKDEGENDCESWVCAGRLKDGRWFFLSAWCDYTGWG